MAGKAIGGRVAERYREHLRAAGITRAVLFERRKERQQIRLHDTRAAFVTVALATGKSQGVGAGSDGAQVECDDREVQAGGEDGAGGGDR
ncbi:hypothetical protein [Polyangium mundeleinium]|uniref:Uncharacterized protein n=1 Tax=Polyangium mundeleinium TaxID=2995306 RepID=A0ABT5EU32_9BACT|nr:hypothetical protein [Polyangium mundeleinium]MDC0744693.1 hypothetical protein [Polyangium mundeleinium]